MLAATSCPLPSTLMKLGRGEGSTHPARDLGASWLSISGLCLRRSICLNVRQAHHCPVMHPVVQTPTERVYGRKTPCCHKKLPGAVAENQGRKKDTAVSLPILIFGKWMQTVWCEDPSTQHTARCLPEIAGEITLSSC